MINVPQPRLRHRCPRCLHFHQAFSVLVAVRLRSASQLHLHLWYLPVHLCLPKQSIVSTMDTKDLKAPPLCIANRPQNICLPDSCSFLVKTHRAYVSLPSPLSKMQRLRRSFSNRTSTSCLARRSLPAPCAAARWSVNCSIWRYQTSNVIARDESSISPRLTTYARRES
jgi:hypothetical protein